MSVTPTLSPTWSQPRPIVTFSSMDGILYGAHSSNRRGTGELLGAIIATVVKTHLQAQAAKSVAVGHQHAHSGMTRAFLNIYKEHGVPGLWRGVIGAMPRSAVGSDLTAGLLFHMQGSA
uniref:Uncharacterized protein n=1 Tax=Timema poppense TaxID=170557 RepID=A0A7R9DQ48_TIMPO|nr:unnamed protein product [Timema poppensis]